MEQNKSNITSGSRKRKCDETTEPASLASNAAPSTRIHQHGGNNNASLHGISYQLRLGLVILLRLYKVHNVDNQFEFTVTFEDPSGGKFDDVIVRYSSPKHGSGTVLIQAKHRQKTGNKNAIDSIITLLLDQKNPLFVGKYFESFLDTYKRNSEETQTYIICTNRSFSCAKPFKTWDPEGNDSLSFLKDIHATCFQLDYQHRLDRIDEVLSKVIVSKTGKNEIDLKSCDRKTIQENVQHFYNSFSMVCGSANDEELESIAMNLLRDVASVHSAMTYKILHYLMFEAMKVGPLSYGPNHLKNVLEKLECMKTFDHVSIGTQQHLETLHLEYAYVQIKPEKLAELKLFNFIKNRESLVHYYYSSFNADISTIIIEQMLKSFGSQMLLIDCASFQGKGLIDRVGDIISALNSHDMGGDNDASRLVITIICRGKFAALEHLSDCAMKVIIVEDMEHAPSGVHSGHQQDHSVEQFAVADLTDDARQKLYEPLKSINLFGTSIVLDKIVKENDSLKCLFNIINFCTKESDDHSHLYVKQYEQIKPWYIDRTFYQNDGEYDDKLIKWYRDIVNEASYFTIKNIGPKVIIWRNEAGSGKSTYFTWLCWYISTNKRSYYVVRLNAGPYSTDFKLLTQSTEPNTLTDTKAVKLLYRFLHLAQFLNGDVRCTDSEIDAERTAAERCAKLLSLSGDRVVIDEGEATKLNLATSQLIELRLFKEKFNQNQIVLVLDAFDEIAPYYKEVVLMCFGAFSKLRGIRHIHIASRPYNFYSEFKSTFPDCVMYQLVQFSESDQKLAIEKYLHEAIKEGSDVDANALLEKVNEMFNGVQSGLTEVPLFLHMAFGVFFAAIESKMKPNNGQVPNVQVETMDSLRLIEMFVEEHLRRLLVEKKQRPLSAMDNSDQRNMFLEVLADRRKEHALLAIFEIFSPEDRSMLLADKQQAKAKEYMKKIEEASEKTGCVQYVRNGIPSFSLRTVAEYFAALWFYRNKSSFKNNIFFRCKPFWMKERNEVRKLFDQMIIRDSEGCEIHSAILNRSEARVRTILSEQPDAVNTAVDTVGRLPIHLTVIYYEQDDYTFESILRLLLEKMTPDAIDHRDDLLRWSALDYAFFSENKDMIDMLLTAGAQVNVDVLVQQLLAKGFNASTFVHTANHYYSLLNLHTRGRVYMKLFHDKIVEDLQSGQKHYYHAGLTYSGILEHFINEKMAKAFKLYVPPQVNSLAQLSKEEKDRLLWVAFEQTAVKIVIYLTEKCSVTLPDILDKAYVVAILNNIIVNNKMPLLRILLSHLCIKCTVPCSEDDEINESAHLQEHVNSPSFQHYNFWGCCSRRTRDSYAHDVVENEYLIAELIATAVDVGNIAMVDYIVRKTKTTINNRLIAEIVRLMPKHATTDRDENDVDCIFRHHRNVCHGKSIAAFNYLLAGSTDLHGEVEEGSNLLQWAAWNGCRYMLPCLIAKGFAPKLVDNINGWKVFNNGQDRSSKATMYSIQHVGMNRFALFDIILKTDTVEGTLEVVPIRAARFNKRQYALLAIYSVFQRAELWLQLLTNKEQQEARLLVQTVQDSECTSEIFEKVGGVIPQFRNDIFADYLAASWLFERRNRYENFMRTRSFWVREFSRVRYFFDGLFLNAGEGCEHSVVVLKHISSIDRFIEHLELSNTHIKCSPHPRHFERKDSTGRLPLHYAVIHYQRDVDSTPWHLMSRLMGDAINERDELCNWSALEYAFVADTERWADVLLQSGAKVNIEVLLEQIKSGTLNEFLHSAHIYGKRLACFENSSDIAPQFHELVVNYLIKERMLNINLPHVELDNLTVWQFLEKNKYIGLLKEFMK